MIFSWARDLVSLRRPTPGFEFTHYRPQSSTDWTIQAPVSLFFTGICGATSMLRLISRPSPALLSRGYVAMFDAQAIPR